jgi:hypothetical protein
VTIPGRGDLVPRRRNRRIGRFLTVVVVVALLAGAGYAGYVGLIQGSSNGSTALTTQRCPAPVKPKPVAPHAMRVRIFNASLQTGLAAQIGSALRHRGFHIAAIGNALRVGHYIALVRYSPDDKPDSATLAAQVSGATTRQVAGHHLLELDLGLKFVDLRSATAAKAAAKRAAVAAAPAPTATPTSC